VKNELEKRGLLSGRGGKKSLLRERKVVSHQPKHRKGHMPPRYENCPRKGKKRGTVAFSQKKGPKEIEKGKTVGLRNWVKVLRSFLAQEFRVI